MIEKEDNSKFTLVTREQYSPVKLLNKQKENPSNDNKITNQSWVKTTMVKISEKNKTSFLLYKDQSHEVILNASKTGMYSYSITNPVTHQVILTIKSNIFSNQFYINDNEKNTVCKVKYNFNFLGLSGPVKMEISLSNKSSTVNSSELFFYNKMPSYSKKYNCYVLKFIDRTIKSSIKNFQLINKENEEDIYLQFALMEDNTYILDYKEPFNALTAFAIGIINLSQKILCEQLKE